MPDGVFPAMTLRVARRLVAPLEEMHDEDVQPVAQFPLITAPQALYLLCQVGIIECLRLLVPQQRRLLLRPG